MQDEPKKKTISNRICRALFLVGLCLIALDAIAYVFGLNTSGAVFAVGMAATMVSAVAGSIFDRSSPRAEDLIAVAMGAAFFIWLVWKNT